MDRSSVQGGLHYFEIFTTRQRRVLQMFGLLASCWHSVALCSWHLCIIHKWSLWGGAF